MVNGENDNDKILTLPQILNFALISHTVFIL